jgi:hypothetical protein
MAILSGRLCAAFIAAFAALLPASLSYAQTTAARFDLTGPRIDVRITRDGKTLPIAAVPNLKVGDRIWLFPDLPRTQSVHYLLVLAFLRGTTNPPPDTWFTKIETWNKKVRQEGVTVTVPEEAQQAILFLAPETGGDFTTLRSAVQGRPGIFVRATQDLAEAGFEQARIEKYLASIRQAPPGDAKALLDHSNLLARTLNLKPNQDCFNRPVDMQYACLTQTGTQTLLDDGHGQTVVSMLSSSDTTAFINAASYTALGGGGLYSAYVGAVVDLVRLMGNLHTAQYQYIPAISFPQAEQLNLRLNTAPSFHNPKSVIVIGLPAIQSAVPPPLRAADPHHVTCLLKPSVVLPVEGAPLVFSTSFAHDLVLHINGGEPRPDIALTPDAFKGGLVLAPATERKPLPSPADEAAAKSDVGKPPPALSPGSPQTPVTGTVTGFWGFDAFTGPTLPLQDVPGTGWKLSTDAVLIAGRDNHLTLSSTGTACINSITFEPSSGRQTEVPWKRSDKPNVVDVTLSLKSVDPGNIHLDVHQYGGVPTAAVTAQTFSEPAQLNALLLHAGDTMAALTGTSLDQVRQITLNNLTFAPAGKPSTSEDATTTEALSLTLPPGSEAPKLRAGDHLIAHVSLRDGRTLSLPVNVAPARPSVNLISHNTAQPSSPIRLANPDALPIGQKLTFSLRSATPFPRDSKVEIANSDDSLRTTLTVASGSLVLQNSHTVLGTFDPLKTFGTSAFGPLRLRAVAPDGTPGDWISLATLVRLPTLQDVHCPADPAASCTLTGSDLYLVDSLSTDANFTNPIDVPEGFVGTTIALPRPSKAGFYLKLRDEPTFANAVNLPVQIQRPAPAPAPSSPPTVMPPVEPAPAASSPPATAPQTTPPQAEHLAH